MLIIKKKSVVFFCVVVSVIVAFVFCFSSLSSLANGNLKSDITVVIDAGHGGIDGGVTGVKTGVKESDLNLEVSRKLEECLLEAGINVVQTRKTNGGLYGMATGGFKKRDMKKRKEIIEEAKPTLVISIHMNNFPISTRRGSQVFYKYGSENGKLLANKVQASLNCMEEAIREYSALKGDFFMLNCSEYTSILVECGFLSNVEDEKLLTNNEYQKKLVFAIFKGVVDYLSQTTAYSLEIKP